MSLFATEAVNTSSHPDLNANRLKPSARPGIVSRTNYQITLEQLQSASQNRRLSEARATIARDVIQEGVATLSEVARHFNRSASALSRAIERYTSNHQP
jgi:hypothetical protein